MINVYFLKDYGEHKKGDWALIGREETTVLHFNRTVETYTEHMARMSIKSEPEKPKRKKIEKETAISKQAGRREMAVNG
ncbi:hypothetical protein LCGC14_0993620 [marine sediment metagenome]|uniref:Uncharacterized protein n=1 Tax=marine sediment metagenome TaxID=412755 RepID=A0A0F9N9M1_9ZZZZ|nr:hypothetical protein [Pricia sp.]